MPHYVIRVARNAGIVALFIVAAMLGILSGVMFAYAGDLPQVSALDDYSPSTITRVLASNGQLIGEFATQRRIVVGYDDINPVLRQAIIATEDADFDRHFGLNVWRIFAAAAIDIVKRRREQGASTLTQQVARDAAQKRRPAADGGRALHHASAGGRRESQADRHLRAAESGAGRRAVLRRGSAQAHRETVRREGAVRERPRGPHDTRRHVAG